MSTAACEGGVESGQGKMGELPTEDDPDPGGGLGERKMDMGHLGEWTGDRQVWGQVRRWLGKQNCDDSSIAGFFQHCFVYAYTDDEEDLLFEWMLKLVSLYVKEDGWEGLREGALKWDWSTLFLGNQWDIPIPEFAQKREEEVLKLEEEDAAAKQLEEDVKRKLEEAAASKQLEEYVERRGGEEAVDVCGEERDGRGECSKEVEEKVTVAVEMVETVSPFPKLDWGEALPPAVIVSPSGTWRPWEETTGNGKLGMGETWQSWSPQMGHRRKKRRSPAAAKRSKLRLLQWQEGRDNSRLQRELRTSATTPFKSSEGLVSTNLTRKFQSGEGGESLFSQCGSQLTNDGGEVVTGSLGRGKAWACSGSASDFQNFSSLRQFVPPTLQTPISWCNPVLPPSPPSSAVPWPGAATSPPLPLTLSGPPPASMWGMLPGLVTSCPSCRAWGLLTSP